MMSISLNYTNKWKAMQDDTSERQQERKIVMAWKSIGKRPSVSLAIYHWPNKIHLYTNVYAFMWERANRLWQFIRAFNLYSGSVVTSYCQFIFRWILHLWPLELYDMYWSICIYVQYVESTQLHKVLKVKQKSQTILMNVNHWLVVWCIFVRLPNKKPNSLLLNK